MSGDSIQRASRARRHVWLSRIVAIAVATVGLSGVALSTPQAANAAEVPAAFNSVTLVANPSNFTITGLANTINGSTAGGDYGRIFTNQANATGVVIDYGFTTPEFQVTGLQLYNNGGGVLTDFDGIGSALVEVFDPGNALLFSGNLVAGNGGGVFLTAFPAPLDNVARVRLSNITNLPGNVAPDIIWRELRALQNVSTPTLATQINADGYSDDVTVSATEGLDGTLDWTLYGPIAAGAGDSCAGLSWVGAPVFASGSVPVTGDGVLVTTPPAAPTAGGCYSYGDILSGPSYTANATSAVGQPAETFFVAPAPAPSISIVKSAAPNDAASFDVGQVITYSFVVTNTGNVPLSAVTVSETAFTGSGAMSAITCPGGNGTLGLAATEEVTCTATYTITQADVDAGTLSNTATAAGTPPAGPAVVSEPSTTVAPADPQPGMSVVKSVSPQSATAAGELVTYSFLVTNTGNVTLTGVDVVEESFSGTGTPPAAVCPPGSLLPGQQVTCEASYTLTQADVDAGTLENTAHAIATPPVGPGIESEPSSAVVDIVQTPSISLVKSVDPTTITGVPQSLTYSFVITNTGDVTLTDVGVNETSFAGHGTPPVAECPTPPAPLAPAASLTCTATYTVVQADIDDVAPIENTATASGTPPLGEPVESEPSSASTIVDPVSAIGVEKSAQPVDLNGDGRTTPGDRIDWTITVTNLGTTTITDIEVTDPTAGAVACPGDSLAPGVSMVCTVEPHTVTAADATAGVAENTASVSGTTPEGTVTADDEASVAVSPTPTPPATPPAGSGALPSTGVADPWAPMTVALLLIAAGVIGVARRKRAI